MTLKEALSKAANTPHEPVQVPIMIADETYLIEVVKVTGMQYADIMTNCPSTTPIQHKSYGHDVYAAAKLATKRHGRLLDADGNPVPPEFSDDQKTVLPTDWDSIFNAISQAEISDLAAVWWDIHIGEPQRRLAALVKEREERLKQQSPDFTE